MDSVKMNWLLWSKEQRGKMFKKRSNNIDRHIQRQMRKLKTVPREAYEHFVKKTPIDTGNARKSTGFIKQNTINAEYGYANRLNEGYSRQARTGMTRPTIDFIRRRIRQLLG